MSSFGHYLGMAGYVIETIGVVERTLNSAATLAIIVFIRIVLGLMLEFEVEGRLPWQRE